MKIIYLILFSIPFLLCAQSLEDLNQDAAKAYNQGNYERALQLIQQAIRQTEHELGQNHPDYFRRVGDLATIYKMMGRYSDAQQIEQENLIAIEKLTGTDNLNFVTASKNLGNTFLASEQYQLAEAHYSRASQSISQILSRNDNYYHDHAVEIFNEYVAVDIQRGLLYQRMGKIYEAERVYNELLTFFKNYLGEDYAEHAFYATIINNLSNIYIELGELNKAENYLSHSIQLSEKWYGTTSPYYLQNRINLATIYKASDRFDLAESILVETKIQITETLGKYNQNYITVLNNLAELAVQQERYLEAEQFCFEAIKIQEEIFGRNNEMYQTLIHNLAEAYQWMNRFNNADSLYQIVIRKVIDDVEKNFSYLTEGEKRSFVSRQSLFISSYANFALKRSGALPLPGLPLHELTKSSLGDLYNVQLATKALILNATAKTQQNILNNHDPVFAAEFKAWKNLKDRIAKQYSIPLSSRLNLDSLIQVAEWYERKLIQNSASFRIGFVSQRVTWKDIQQKLRPGEAAVELIRFYDGLIYAALIVTSTTKHHPEIALIKSTKTMHLEKEFLGFYKNCIRFQVTDTISYATFWEPVFNMIKAHDNRIKKIYLSPDGIYNEINLNTLYNSKSKHYVLDETEIHLLTNTRELINLSDKLDPGNRSAVLIGQPSYGDFEAANKNNYTDLEGTGREVLQISTLLRIHGWTTTVLLGEHATERLVKLIQNPQLLHLATHGYFIPAKENRTNEDYVRAMLQSGIILANANTTQDEADDGILTAYEAMLLPLDATELVVLSACETGLGSVDMGEGVYGLQRALMIAGTKSILMSLWKVDDTATQELMSLIYQNKLRGKSWRKAFSTAQVELRKKYAQPYFWGAFVMIGR